MLDALNHIFRGSDETMALKFLDVIMHPISEQINKLSWWIFLILHKALNVIELTVFLLKLLVFSLKLEFESAQQVHLLITQLVQVLYLRLFSFIFEFEIVVLSFELLYSDDQIIVRWGLSQLHHLL